MGIFDFAGDMLGGIFGKPPTEQTTTAQSDPWGPIQPHLMDYANAGRNWFGSAWSPEQMVAGMSPEQLQAMGMMNQRAMMGSPLMGAAQGEMFNTLTGRSAERAFNPLFDTASRRMGETFRNITMPAIGARFGAAGRGGSGLESQAYKDAMGQLATGLGDLASSVYGQERQNQMGLIPMAPQMAQADYADLDRLMGVGGMRRDYAQQMMDAPYGRLSQWGNLMGPFSGYGTQTTTQPINRNPIGSALGGAAMGYGMGGPWGAAIGGGLGLLGGYGY